MSDDRNWGGQNITDNIARGGVEAARSIHAQDDERRVSVRGGLEALPQVFRRCRPDGATYLE
jgi:hypothetical protein